MRCRICGGDVDDPFWDELCPDCRHDSFHGDANFDPSCGSCIADAEDKYDSGLRWDGTQWVNEFAEPG